MPELKTTCPHCGKYFEVSDKTLGKQARCKSCTKAFVIQADAVEEIPMKEVRTHAEADQGVEDRDPLAALANAATDSTTEHIAGVREHAIEHGSSLTRKETGETGDVAAGAWGSMIMGIIALTGMFTCVLAPIGAILAILAITYGSGARKRIRRARGTLEGAKMASAGIILGWVSLLLLVILLIGGVILLIQTGGFTFQEIQQV